MGTNNTKLAFDFQQLLADVEKAGKQAELEVEESEISTTVSENVVNLLRAAQIHKLLLPKQYGGPQLSLYEYSQVVRTASKCNLSAGWLAYLYSIHNTWVAFLPAKGREEIIQHGGLLADILPPVGEVEQDGQGYRLTGTYNFVSGVLHSDWVGLGAKVLHHESNQVEYCILVVKTSEITINKNWNTLGLRGTGSNQVVAENVYIPPHRVVRMSEVEKTMGKPPADIQDDGYVVYHRPYMAVFCVGFSMIALGGAERMLEEFKKATEKRTRIDGTKEKDSPRSQRVYAELKMKYREAEGLLNYYIDTLENYPSIEPVALEEFFAIRGRIAKIVSDIAVKVLLTLGGAAAYKGNPVEQFTRDILTLATHRTQLYEDALAVFGKNQFNS